jgi:hypothetical protein
MEVVRCGSMTDTFELLVEPSFGLSKTNLAAVVEILLDWFFIESVLVLDIALVVVVVFGGALAGILGGLLFSDGSEVEKGLADPVDVGFFFLGADTATR